MCMRRAWREERAREVKREDPIRDPFEDEPIPKPPTPTPVAHEPEPEREERSDKEKVPVGA